MNKQLRKKINAIKYAGFIRLWKSIQLFLIVSLAFIAVICLAAAVTPGY